MSGVGIRTPPIQRKATINPKDKSPQTAPEEAGPSTQSVRKSVGEWEAGKTDKKGPSPTKTVKTTPMIAKGSVSFEIGSPPAQKCRVAEARICLNKIKTLMTTSRNTKNEIKTDVKAQADRLYSMIKEYEQEKGRETLTKKTYATKGIQVQEKLRAEEAPPPSPEAIREVEVDSLRKALEEHSRNLAVNNENMERLKEALLAGQEHMGKLSYASVVASQPSKHAPTYQTLHSIVVTAKDESKTGDQVLDSIRKAVNAKEGGICVERIRKAKDRRVILGCRTEEDRKKIRDKIGEAPELSVQDIKNKNPQVVLKGVFNYNNNEEILRALRNQNGNVFRDLNDEQSKIEVLYRKRTRNPHQDHIVLRVATEVWKRMLDVGALHVEMQRVMVEDQSPLVQCSLCLGYGHSRRLCTETVAKCGHCGGPHMRADCMDRNAGLPPSCCNCTRANIDNANHHAFSTECTIRRKWEAISRSTIAYC